MKIITVHCKAIPERREELVNLCMQMISSSRSEKGCLHYGFYKDVQDENHYVFYEEWKDQTAIDLHNASKHFIDFQPKFTMLLTEPAVVTIHTVE